MTVLYPNPATRRIVEQAIANGKVILWLVDSLRSLYINPNITSGSTVGATVTPTDGGIGMGADIVIRGGPDGFALAATNAGAYRGSGLSSEFEDDAAAQLFFAGATFIRGSVYLS